MDWSLHGVPMRHALPVLAGFFFFASPLFAQYDPIYAQSDPGSVRMPLAERTPPAMLGGLMIMRDGNQTTMSLGGILFPRKVKVTTNTPAGPITTRFVLPSAFHSPNAVPLPGAAPALLQVERPDVFGIIYIEGQLIVSHGMTRRLESPPLPPGLDHPLKLRAAFAVGDKLLIEDQTILLRAGESLRVTFDGSRAIAFALPRAPGWTAPIPNPPPKK